MPSGRGWATLAQPEGQWHAVNAIRSVALKKLLDMDGSQRTLFMEKIKRGHENLFVDEVFNETKWKERRQESPCSSNDELSDTSIIV